VQRRKPPDKPALVSPREGTPTASFGSARRLGVDSNNEAQVSWRGAAYCLRRPIPWLTITPQHRSTHYGQDTR
jgi:hypothetical protein